MKFNLLMFSFSRMFNSEYASANESGEYEVAQGITAIIFKQILVRNHHLARINFLQVL